MKRISCILVAMLAVASCSYFVVGQEKADPKPETKSATWKEPKAAPKASTATARRDLTLRQRRELGLTLPNLANIARTLKDEGEIDRDTPAAEAAALIALKLQDANPKAFAESEALDIQTILDLIERLMPFIMMLIDLFSAPN